MLDVFPIQRATDTANWHELSSLISRSHSCLLTDPRINLSLHSMAPLFLAHPVFNISSSDMNLTIPFPLKASDYNLKVTSKRVVLALICWMSFDRAGSLCFDLAVVCASLCLSDLYLFWGVHRGGCHGKETWAPVWETLGGEDVAAAESSSRAGVCDGGKGHTKSPSRISSPLQMCWPSIKSPFLGGNHSGADRQISPSFSWSHSTFSPFFSGLQLSHNALRSDWQTSHRK